MNQRQKFGFFLTALVALPVFSLGLFGLNTMKSELNTYQLQEQQVMSARLSQLDQKISQHLYQLKLQLQADVLDVHSQGLWALRCTFQQSCPQYEEQRINLIVSFDENGDRIYPPREVTEQLYSESQTLKQIASALSTAKNKLYNLPAPSRSQGVWSAYLTSQGHQLLYCWRNKINYTFCAVLNREWIIQEVSKVLAQDVSHDNLEHIRLINIDNKSIWQNKDPFSATITAQKQLSNPLYFWHLEAFQTKPTTSRNFFLTIAALTLPLAALLTVIAVFLFRSQKQALAEADKRTAIAASVSHELRTPLTNLQLYADLILSKTKKSPSTNDNKDITSYTKVIAAETARLSDLVNNALTISKGKNPNKRLKTSAIPDHIITETISRLTPLLGDDHNKISYNLAASEQVMIDASALEQILVNLIDNARKYAKGKRIRISSKLELSKFTLTVRDWGNDFKSNKATALFSPFSQQNTPQTGTPEHAGFGLGLAVCKQLAQANNGTITCEPAHPGARFILTMQIGPIEKTSAKNQRKASSCIS